MHMARGRAHAEGRFEFLQRVGPVAREHQEAAGDEHAVNLAQRRQRIARPGKRKIRPHHIDAGRAKGQPRKIRAQRKPPGAGHEAPAALEKSLLPFRLAEYSGRKVHAQKIGLGVAPAQQFQAVSHDAHGVEQAMGRAGDVIEPLQHAPLDFRLEHGGVPARRRGTLEGAPYLCRVQAECLCVHPDSVMAEESIRATLHVDNNFTISYIHRLRNSVQSTGASAMVVAIVLVLLVVGSVLFHFLSPWYFTPIASNWSAMDHTISLTFWVTGSVFVAINLFMAYCVIRYRYKKGKRAQYEPENKKLEWWLTGLTTVGVAAMLAPGLFVCANFVEIPKDAGVFEAMGKQWYWGFRFPGKDGVMGTVDAKYVSDKNPFGMNPDDPNGQDDVLVSSPELHLPLGRPVQALLR